MSLTVEELHGHNVDDTRSSTPSRSIRRIMPSLHRRLDRTHLCGRCERDWKVKVRQPVARSGPCVNRGRAL